jgi:hypothetical protein
VAAWIRGSNVTSLEALLPQDPLVQSVVLPLLTAFLVAPFLAALRPSLAGVAIPFGFLLGYLAAVGQPPFPPVSSGQKLPYLVLLAVVGGAAFERPGLAPRVFMAAWAAASLGWLAWPRLSGDAQAFAVAGVAVGVGIMLELSRRSLQDVCVALLAAALGLSAVAFMGASASIAQAAGGLAAATGGMLLWSWPRERWPLGTAALAGAAGALLLLLQQSLLYTRADPFALLALAAVAFVPLVAGPSLQSRGRYLRAVMLAGWCLVPVAAALLVAWLRWR